LGAGDEKNGSFDQPKLAEPLKSIGKIIEVKPWAIRRGTKIQWARKRIRVRKNRGVVEIDLKNIQRGGKKRKWKPTVL